MTKHDDELRLTVVAKVRMFLRFYTDINRDSERYGDEIMALIKEQVRLARQSELEMFKKIPITQMSREITTHITKRIAQLEQEEK